MKGYWLIIGTEVTDAEAQAEYGKLWQPIAKRYGARINPTPVAPFLAEARDARRVIVVEFPSLAQARACYDDPAYAEARTLAHRAAQRELLIFEGDLG